MSRSRRNRRIDNGFVRVFPKTFTTRRRDPVRGTGRRESIEVPSEGVKDGQGGILQWSQEMIDGIDFIVVRTGRH